MNFDDAGKIYAQIIDEAPDEADAYWGLVLCRYGIEYVTDKDGSQKATCHRTIEIPIQADADFKLACEKASSEQREFFIEQAKYIDDVQRKILEIVHKEKPYDVFISYKAKDADGNPTVDSKEAQRIYHNLTNQGYRVFFAEETLRNLVGNEYEPVIYAALKSSKIMILLGGKVEHFEATWVKNEWRRYLDMIAHGDEKTLLPVYYDMDPYMLPPQLANLQALNWRDSEAMVTLLKVVEDRFENKVSDRKNESLERAIDQRDFNNAKIQYENAYKLYENRQSEEAIGVLDDLIKARPNYAEAYWLRMVLKLGVKLETLPLQQVDISNNPDYLQAVHNAEEAKAGEYQRIKDICLRNIKVQEEYNREAEVFRKDFTTHNPSIPGMKQAKAIKDELKDLITKNIFEACLSGEELFTWIAGTILLALKLPVSVGTYLIQCGILENMEKIQVAILLGLALLFSLVLVAVIYGGPVALSYWGYNILIENGILKFVTMVPSIGIALYLLFSEKLMGFVEAFQFKRTMTGKDILPVVIFYAVDILVILVISVINIRKIGKETKNMSLRQKYGELVKDYENSLNSCVDVIRQRNAEMQSSYLKKKTSEQALFNTKDLDSDYANWIIEEVRHYKRYIEKKNGTNR